jgi:hypothetical protein
MTSPDLFAATATRSSTPTTRLVPTEPKRGRIRRSFIVHDGEGSDARTITLIGRVAWALGELIHAGDDGCTPLTTPGPRWSSYVFKLKRLHGLMIESITEQHGGDYSGKHARYVLRSRVEFADPAGAQAPRAYAPPTHAGDAP